MTELDMTVDIDTDDLADELSDEALDRAEPVFEYCATSMPTQRSR